MMRLPLANGGYRGMMLNDKPNNSNICRGGSAWRYLIASLLLFLLSQFSFAGIVYLKERNFLYNTAATDSTWHEDNPTDPYPDVEYLYGRSYQVPGVVYVKGGSKSITLTFKNTAFYPVNATFKITGIRFVYHLWIVPVYTYVNVPSDVPISFSAQQEKSATFNFEIPDSIFVGDIQVQTRLVSSGGSVLWGDPYTWMDWGKFYTVLQTPIGFQAQPWMDLLDMTCRWAYEDATEAECSEDLTKGLFWDSPWVYSDEGVWHWAGTSFLLSDAVRYEHYNMDCKDTAGFLYLAFQSQGIDSELRYLKDEGGVGFVTNPICPMGSDATIDTIPNPNDPNNPIQVYSVRVWTHHVVVFHDGVCDSAAAQRLDLDGYSYRNPPFNWALQGYWQTPYGNPTYLGLVNRLYGQGSPDAVTLDSNTLFTMTEI